jgi:hypothetical protein
MVEGLPRGRFSSTDIQSHYKGGRTMYVHKEVQILNQTHGLRVRWEDGSGYLSQPGEPMYPIVRSIWRLRNTLPNQIMSAFLHYVGDAEGVTEDPADLTLEDFLLYIESWRGE